MDIHHPHLTFTALTVLAALLSGVVMNHFRQPAIIGYILTGVLLGPSALGLVKDTDAISTLAEFGVLMLLFVIGIELDLRRFVQGWKTALLTTVLQIAGSVGAALLMRHLLGWSFGLSLILGFAVALSSTAVVIKMLESSGDLDQPVGRTIIGILIAQDMAVVPMMLFLDSMERKGIAPLDMAKVVFSVVFLIALFWVLLRGKIRLPLSASVMKSPELGPLTAITWCLGAAALSGLMDMSPAYGAFLAGVVIGNSSQRETIFRNIRPVQNILLMVFFLSIGLLLDFKFIWKNLGSVLTLLLMVTLFKTALNIGALRLLRQSWPSAFVAGVALAQMGEFSFLLAEIGKAGKLITATETKLVVAVAVLSLALSPFWLFTMRRLHRAAESGATGFKGLLNGAYQRELGFMSRTLTIRRTPMKDMPEEDPNA